MSEWISCTFRPPAKDVPILVHAIFLEFPVSVLWYEDGTYGEPGFFQEGGEYIVREKDMLYWMPLPQPPKMDK